MERAIRFLLAFLLVFSSGTPKMVEEGQVYLTVSSIDFSLVGESENIYVGTAPIERIHWSSEDPSIVSVEKGVLTANGVGKTVIHADYGSQHWQCQAGCLAKDEASLAALDHDILVAPKRLPPVTDYNPVPYFSDTAIVGDSISFIFYQNEQMSNQLGHPLFLSRGGSSINGFVKHYYNLTFRGQNTSVEQAVADSGKKKVFIMLGQNDLGYMTIEETLDNYRLMIENIRSLSPNVEIIIESCCLMYGDYVYHNEGNEKIQEFNQALPALAEELGCGFVDVFAYTEDHTLRLPPMYSLDQGIHMNYDGCYVWGQILSAYAEQQEMYQNK